MYQRRSRSRENAGTCFSELASCFQERSWLLFADSILRMQPAFKPSMLVGGKLPFIRLDHWLFIAALAAFNDALNRDVVSLFLA